MEKESKSTIWTVILTLAGAVILILGVGIWFLYSQNDRVLTQTITTSNQKVETAIRGYIDLIEELKVQKEAFQDKSISDSRKLAKQQDSIKAIVEIVKELEYENKYKNKLIDSLRRAIVPRKKFSTESDYNRLNPAKP